MTGAEFTRRVRKLGRQTGIHVEFRKRAGRGSHGTLYFGKRKTTVKDRKKEIGEGLYQAMLKQLGLKKTDLE